MADIPGTPDNDTLDGTELADSIAGEGGDDQIYADLGDDLVYGGSGNDTLFPGGGNDQLYGGDGNDLIFANDLNLAGTGLVRGGAGDDFVQIYSTSGGDLRGGDGLDTLGIITISNRDLTVNLGAGLLDGGPEFFPGVTFSSFEVLEVTSLGGDDSILGGAFDDRLAVGGGANFVDAGAGNDIVEFITRDANTLSGGDGTDLLIVGCGPSSLYFVVDTFGDTIDDGSLSTISGFETYRAFGGEFEDVAALGFGDDYFLGRDGADTGIGRDGADSLSGGAQNDTLTGGDGRDVLNGDAGDDNLDGGKAGDIIRGGAGNDRIDAGYGDDRISFYLGNDTVKGGVGADSFEFTRTQWGHHLITDFETSIDHLMILGSAVSPFLGAGALDPSLLSFGTPAGPQGQFVLVYSAGTDRTSLLWDANGDDPAGGRTMIVDLQGNVTLMASDILIV